MRNGCAAIVVALTRCWMRVYTWRMPARLAVTRCEEIESDVWEMQHDAELRPGLWWAAIALQRLICGMPDDLAWRFENATVEERLVSRRTIALTMAAIFVLGLWTAPALLYEQRLDVADCAEAVPNPQIASTHFEVIRCVGAFFYLPPDIVVGSATWQIAGVSGDRRVIRTRRSAR